MKFMRDLSRINCFALLVVLTVGTLRVFAYSPSAEDRPAVDISSAIAAAERYVSEELRIPQSFVAWASLTRTGDDVARKWITAWYPVDDRHERKTEYVVVSVEKLDDKIIVEKVNNPVGFGEIGKIDGAIGIASAMAAAGALAKDKAYSTDHYIWRAGLGKIRNSEKVCWIVCWWPEIHAKDTRPIVVVNMNGESAEVDEPVTWLAIKKIELPLLESIHLPAQNPSTDK